MGCAGGGDSLITLPVEQDVVDPASFDSYRQERTDVATIVFGLLSVWTIFSGNVAVLAVHVFLPLERLLCPLSVYVFKFSLRELVLSPKVAEGMQVRDR